MNTLALTLLLQFITFTFGDDFAVAINQSAIAKIQIPLMPLVQSFFTDQVTIKIKPITSLDYVTVTIDPLQFLYIDPSGFVMSTNASRGTIDIKITDLDVLLDRLKVTVEVPPEYGENLQQISCDYWTTPNISKWNASFSVDPNKQDVDECYLNIQTVKSSIKIIEYKTDFKWELGGPFSFCRMVFGLADTALGNELEDIIKDLVIDEVAKFINKQLEREVNKYLDKLTEYDGAAKDDNTSYFQICFSEVIVGEDSVKIGAAFSLEELKYTPTTPKGDPLLELNSKDDLTLIIVWIIFCILSWCWGFGCMYCSKKCYETWKDRNDYDRKMDKHDSELSAIDEESSHGDEGSGTAGATNGSTYYVTH